MLYNLHVHISYSNASIGLLLLTSDLHEKGRVLALLRDVDVDLSSEPTDGVTGMAYEVEEEDWPAVLEALDIRERHGYTRRVGVWVCDSPITKKLIVTFCFDWVESLVCCFFLVFGCFDMEACWGSALKCIRILIQNHGDS